MNWNSFPETKPEHEQWCLAYTDEPNFEPEGWWFHAYQYRADLDCFATGARKQPTHWMPLPEPPNRR